MKTYLRVPFKHKDRVKALGARFDMGLKQWYCPDGVDLAPLMAWVPTVSKKEVKAVKTVLAAKPPRQGGSKREKREEIERLREKQKTGTGSWEPNSCAKVGFSYSRWTKAR